MSYQKFQDLRVYQLSEKLADSIWKIVYEWELLAQDTMGKQMIRSTDSIGANIAEGTGRGSFKDNRRFVIIPRGSLYETQHWLRIAYVRGFLSTEQIDSLKQIINNLAPQLNSYLNSIGKNTND